MEINLSAEYYRAKKDSFLWKEGAILEVNPEQGSRGVGGCQAVSDVWDYSDCIGDEYISADIIEAAPDWFERVYPIKKGGKVSFATKDETKVAYGTEFEPITIK